MNLEERHPCGFSFQRLMRAIRSSGLQGHPRCAFCYDLPFGASCGAGCAVQVATAGRWIDTRSGSKLCEHSYRKVVGDCISICLDAEPEKRLNTIPLIFQMTTLLNDPRFQYLSNRADTLPDVRSELSDPLTQKSSSRLLSLLSIH